MARKTGGGWNLRVRGQYNPGMDERAALLAEIEAEMRATAHWTGRARLSPRVAAALAKVRRAAFVPPRSADAAYANAPLPIGHGQTISQPFVVALMTELLDLGPDDSVLEVGTGSGYQAAVLAELAGNGLLRRGDPGTGPPCSRRSGGRRLCQRCAAHRGWRARLA